MACRILPRMPRLFVLVVSLAVPLILAFSTTPSRAQSFDATSLSQPANLDTGWLVHAGDDPAFARADFDDSHWARYEGRMTLPDLFGSDRTEILWFRLHVRVAPAQTGLALAESRLSRAYDVYVNGHRILQDGRVTPFEPYTANAELIQRIPDQEIGTGSLVIALRVHLGDYEWYRIYPRGIGKSLTLGQESTLRDFNWLTVIGMNFFDWIYDFTGFGLGIVTLALFAAQRSNREYFWIFLMFFAVALQLPLTLFESFHDVPATWELGDQALLVLQLVCSILIYFAFLHIRPGRRMRTLLFVIIAGLAIAIVGGTWGNFGVGGSLIALFPLVAMMAGVIPILLVIHFRRGNREAGILLIPAILGALDLYEQLLFNLMSAIPALAPVALRWREALNNLHAGPFSLRIGDLGDLLSLLALAIIIVLRSTRISRQQTIFEGELAAAREVQQVILPEEIETVPGFTVHAVYKPAQQVGGDFFQILPTDEGGILLVVGDVAGKGLPAAMLVSVVVGSVRTAAEDSHDPALLLSRLNNRLVGRSRGGFSTALAAHITPDGSVTIANAGQLSPYLDGREVVLPGALPLGILRDATYETTPFHLPHGSRLTFCTDGVVEAQSKQGELFGFDRAQSISTEPAAAIVAAAVQFGQSDDIT